MRPGAVVWADFDPLWCTLGDAHDEAIGYEQGMLSNDELATRFRPGSEGALFWRTGILSRLRVGEYRSILEKYFAIGSRFKKAYPDRWRELCRKESEKDLLVWAVYFLGQQR